jgi:hypothetical protein
MSRIVPGHRALAGQLADRLGVEGFQQVLRSLRQLSEALETVDLG